MSFRFHLGAPGTHMSRVCWLLQGRMGMDSSNGRVVLGEKQQQGKEEVTWYQCWVNPPHYICWKDIFLGFLTKRTNNICLWQGNLYVQTRSIHRVVLIRYSLNWRLRIFSLLIEIITKNNYCRCQYLPTQVVLVLTLFLGI